MSATHLSPDALVGMLRDTLLKDKGYQLTTLGAFVRDFLAWLELSARSEETLRSYEHSFARLCTYVGDKHPDHVTTEDLQRVLQGYNTRSRRVRYVPIRMFFEWCRVNDIITKDPCDRLPKIRQPEREHVEIFTDTEIEAITLIPTELRDRVLVRILLETGIRNAETRGLQLGDADLAQRRLIVRRGKGGKPRVVPFQKSLAEQIAELAILEGIDANSYLWYTTTKNRHASSTQRDNPLSGTAFHMWWKRILEDCGVRYRSAHVCRHTFATRWLRDGERIETLSRALGHASIATTSDTYAHLDVADIKDAIDRLTQVRA